LSSKLCSITKKWNRKKINMYSNLFCICFFYHIYIYISHYSRFYCVGIEDIKELCPSFYFLYHFQKKKEEVAWQIWNKLQTKSDVSNPYRRESIIWDNTIKNIRVDKHTILKNNNYIFVMYFLFWTFTIELFIKKNYCILIVCTSNPPPNRLFVLHQTLFFKERYENELLLSWCLKVPVINLRIFDNNNIFIH